MNVKLFEQIRVKYGHVSSWAIWSDTRNGDTSDISMFHNKLNDKILQRLHTKTVFVGLNISGPVTKQFGNFHGGRRDFMLRDAISGTILEGSYITDLIKLFPEVNSANVAKFFKRNIDELLAHYKELCGELDSIGATKDTKLIVLGNVTYELLLKCKPKYKIFKITHYSHQISKDSYIREIQDLVNHLQT